MHASRQPAPADIGYILATLRFRWRWVGVPVAVFVALGLLAPLYLGDRYISEATLLVEPPRIAGDGAEAFLNEEIETLRLVEQYALSDTFLTELAAALGELDEGPADLNKRIRITTTGGPARGAPGAPITVDISFTAPKAELSKRATSEIVAFVLSEHAARRAGRADGTLAHFSGEAARLGATLAAAEGRLREFELRNQASLPESLAFRRTQRADLRAQIMQIDRDRSDLEAELAGIADQPPTNASEQLGRLREDRAALAAVLSPTNPRLATLDARIRAIEADQGAVTTPSAEPRAELEARLSALTVQREGLAAEIDALSRSIEETPGIASDLATLQRDLHAAERNYEIALDRKAGAEAGAQVDRLQAEGRIAVLHPAVLPEHPDGAGRATLAALGGAFGFFAGLFLLVAREMFDTTIRRPRDLRTALDIDPFAVIPVLSMPTSRRLGSFNTKLGGLN
ncbi:Uncharacterized protein involved in exopolysaccharide biosynthesis [Palleronia marisminoris]|uniref:Chromosome partition protein Smc n=1 Tax=Palleronia marisminoris TaxID=315423 RepID=A0A1Y5SH89_9RHOB|nr:hypothetical protein [Palleronia marisminoris]SFG82942.1 Uncharacterized protein involved in exopolysaccharide biosynthesis [Palleronia marisminoris]SLN40782.1 Chromosome partition protein Smc [Palleronia marisminoris]